ncbi:MAG: hypothetical protein ACREVV_10760 [Steroidobacteraceae bacterium]
MLTQMTHLAAQEIPHSVAEDISARKLLTQQIVDGALLRVAVDWLGHMPTANPYLFGVPPIVSAVLFRRPQVLGQWLADNLLSAISQTVVAYFAEALVFSTRASSIHRQLLQTGRPILQALVAAALARKWQGLAPPSFRDFVTFARASGVDPQRAFVLGLASASTLHFQRIQALARVENTHRRIAYVRQHPEQAVGGPLQAENEIARLVGSLPELNVAATRAESTIDSVIAEMAEAYPAQGLDETQASAFRSEFPNHADQMCIRLAQALRAGGHTFPLLDAVINDFVEMLDLDHPEVPQANFYLDEKRFPTARRWAAKAYVLRFASGSKSSGHRLAQTLAPVTRASAAMLELPYAAARLDGYGRTMKRYFAVISFALEVALADPAKNSKLMDLALAEARKALKGERSDIDSEGWADHLLHACVWLMSTGQAPDERSRWFNDAQLPAYARALALWSDCEQVREDLSRARQLFDAAAMPTAAPSLERGLRRTLNLLDLALTASVPAGDREVSQCVLELWWQIYEPWRALAGPQWRRAHLKLYIALQRPGRTRDDLLADPSWRQSRAVGWIRTHMAGVNYFFRSRQLFLPVWRLHQWSTIGRSDAFGVRSSVSAIHRGFHR